MTQLCQTADKIHQRALAGAIKAHQRSNLASSQTEAQILQRRLLAAGIRKGYVLHLQNRRLFRFILLGSRLRGRQRTRLLNHPDNSALLRRHLRQLQRTAQLHRLRLTQS